MTWFKIDDPEHPAPKDGTPVDLWHPTMGRFTDCWWDDDGWISAPEDVTHWLPMTAPLEAE